MLTVTNPLGYVKEMKYNALGKIELTTNEEGRTTRTLYDERGNIKSVYDGYSVFTQQNIYEDAYQTKSIIEKKSSGKIIKQYSFNYDAGGKIIEETGVNVTSNQLAMVKSSWNTAWAINSPPISTMQKTTE